MKWGEVVEELRGYLNSGENIPPRAYTAIKLALNVLECIDNRVCEYQGAADEE